MYHSALPFCPSSSWLHHYNPAELLQVVKVVKGSTEWGMCSRTAILDSFPMAITSWNNTIAVGLKSGKITFLDAITGSQLAVLSKHTDWVRSITFSSDGSLFVSGSNDKTIQLWDVQTGGVIKSFSGHTDSVLSVSISLDNTTIASGSNDGRIRLWTIQTGQCHCVIIRRVAINSVSFSPTNSQLLISASKNTIEQWDVYGFKVGTTYEGDCVAFSLDGTCFIGWSGKVATIRNSGSGVVVAELQSPHQNFGYCCFSPNSKYVAGSVGTTIYVWSITGSDPHLIQTLTGHTSCITSLTFSPSLTSASEDGLVKFWQSITLQTDPVTTDIMSTSLTPTPIRSTSLQARGGIAITSDDAGTMKTWDITTGLCMASFQTPATGSTWRDAQVIEGRLVLAWWEDEKLHIWDAEKEESIQTVDTPLSDINGIRISGDGSKILCLSGKSILAWSMQTGDIVGRVELEDDLELDPLCADGSKIWIHLSNPSILQGWNFGTPEPSLIPPSRTHLDRPHLDLVDGHNWWNQSSNKIRDTVTGEEVLHLSGRYGKPFEVQWDGQYLVAGYESGEVLILDFNHVPSH